ncbi:MAG: triose-phosphate isomerase family protein [Oscillospiraceae bacterium]
MNLKERKAIIAGNWKLNKRVAEIPAFTQELQANLPAERCCDVVICAPYPLIAALETAGQGCHLGVGAQDVSEHQHGAFTGEVSAEQLSDLGAQYCIVGHSERRSYHGETDLQVNTKTKILLDNSITPIICVGESLAQREHDLTETYGLSSRAAFGLTAEQAMHCVIAYEPLGPSAPATPPMSAQAQEVCAAIRATLGKLYDLETAKTISILTAAP